MTANGWFQIGVYFILLLAITKPLGVYMARVFSSEKTFMDPMLRPVERLLYRMTGVDETHEMRWTEYATAMLLLSVVSMILLYVIMRVQQWLPWNPQHFGAVAPDLAFNTAASFTTNTNWQVYSGESTMSYFTQMAGLAYHNFLSAATGIALAIAVIRGIARKEMQTIGNFWVDLTRTILWVLLPACVVAALFLVSQGTVQSLKPYVTAKLVDPQTAQVTGSDGRTTTQHVTEQSITLGANQVHGITFAVSDAEKLKDDARRLAMKNSQHRAQLYAAAAGAEFGPVLRVAEGGLFDDTLLFQIDKFSGRQTSTASLEVGTQTLAVTVQVIYALR